MNSLPKFNKCITVCTMLYTNIKTPVNLCKYMCWSRGRKVLNPLVRRKVIHCLSMRTSTNMQLKLRHCPAKSKRNVTLEFFFFFGGKIWCVWPTASTGHYNITIREFVLYGPGHEKNDVEERESDDKNNENIVVLHVRPGQLIWPQCFELSHCWRGLCLWFSRNQPSVYTEMWHKWKLILVKKSLTSFMRLRRNCI